MNANLQQNIGGFNNSSNNPANYGYDYPQYPVLYASPPERRNY